VGENQIVEGGPWKEGHPQIVIFEFNNTISISFSSLHFFVVTYHTY